MMRLSEHSGKDAPAATCQTHFNRQLGIYLKQMEKKTKTKTERNVSDKETPNGGFRAEKYGTKSINLKRSAESSTATEGRKELSDPRRPEQQGQTGGTWPAGDLWAVAKEKG